MRTFSLLLCLIVILPAFAARAETIGPAEGEVRLRGLGGQCQELVYSANPSYPPYHWVDEDGRFQGASIALLKLVAPPGLVLKPAVLPWKRALALAEQGRVDLLLSLRNTPERAKFLSFTSARAFPNPIVVFAREDRTFTFASWADLKGKRGGISLGDTFGEGFDEYWRAELSIEEAKNMAANFEKLEAGRIDYFVTSKFVGEAYCSSQPLKHGIVQLGKPISNQDIHFGFSKRSPCAALVEQMDGAPPPTR
ncbi:substrate-binding periplasmic protein [Humidesulfovibrio sp.]